MAAERAQIHASQPSASGQQGRRRSGLHRKKHLRVVPAKPQARQPRLHLVSREVWAKEILTQLQDRHPAWLIIGRGGTWWALRGGREICTDNPHLLEQYICTHDVQEAAEEQRRSAHGWSLPTTGRGSA